jgi:hypothetical protein
MGYARWYFLIDNGDIPHAITHPVAALILDGSVPHAVPQRDSDGVLLVSVGIRLQDGVPSAIHELALYPLAASEESTGRPITPILPAVADNLCTAIRQKLNRRKIQRLERIEEAPFAALRADIFAGKYRSWVYDDLLGSARQAMYPPRGLRAEN